MTARPPLGFPPPLGLVRSSLLGPFRYLTLWLQFSERHGDLRGDVCGGHQDQGLWVILQVQHWRSSSMEGLFP